MSASFKAHAGLISTNLFFAINFSAVKYFAVTGYAGPFAINIIRIGVSVILFWIVFIFKRPVHKIDRADIPKFILCALTAIALNQMLFVKGVALSFPIHASLLTLITPILITIIAARVLNEKITLLKTFGLLLGVAGAGVLISHKEITGPGENVILGDTLVILSSIAYTFYFIMVKPLMNKYSPVQVIRWLFTFGFIMTLPFCIPEFNVIKWEVFTVKEWILLFLLVIPGTFLAYVFNVYGIQKLSASIAGIYIYSQPIFAVIIATTFLNEDLSFLKILAGLLIFTGVFLSTRKPNNMT